MMHLYAVTGRAKYQNEGRGQHCCQRTHWSHASNSDVTDCVYPNSKRTLLFALLQKDMGKTFPMVFRLKQVCVRRSFAVQSAAFDKETFLRLKPSLSKYKYVTACPYGIQEVSDPTFCQIIDLSGRAWDQDQMRAFCNDLWSMSYTNLAHIFFCSLKANLCQCECTDTNNVQLKPVPVHHRRGCSP